MAASQAILIMMVSSTLLSNQVVFCDSLKAPNNNKVYSCPLNCTCSHNVSDLIVDCSNAGLQNIPSDVPKQVHTLYLQENNIKTIETGSFQRLSILSRLNISWNNVTTIEEGALESKSLNTLDLSHQYLFNGLKKKALQLSIEDSKMLHKTLNLSVLYMDGVNISLLSNNNTDGKGGKALRNLIGCLKSLKVLSLVNCSINTRSGDYVHDVLLPNNFLTGLVSLEELYLSYNKLHFTGLNQALMGPINLKVLYLDNNAITQMYFLDLPLQVWRTLVRLNLANNHWNCNCFSYQFFKLFFKENFTKSSMINPHIVNIHITKAYTCDYPANLRPLPIHTLMNPDRHSLKLAQFWPNFENCYAVQEDSSFQWFALFLLIVCLLVLILSCLERQNTKLEDNYYTKDAFPINQSVLEYLISGRKSRNTSSVDYQFDVFISYHSDSTITWVKEEFLEHMEKRAGLRCCLHERNWLPGNDIIDNITASMTFSEKIVLVVNSSYVNSGWCQLEMKMANRHQMLCKADNILLIFLEDLLPQNVDPLLALLMQTQTFIKWEPDPKMQDLFWKKVLAFLKPSYMERADKHFLRAYGDPV